MTTRQQVSVIDALKGSAKGATASQLPMPTLFAAPIRTDVVALTHRDLAKNKRQAFAVKEWAGHQTSAISWGTGRAVARIPRVSGGGTSRSGQGAFGNMCRSGRMFAPTKIWRRWHRHVNVGQKRYATVSALAASAVPALVMARGHHINKVPEVPLVVSDAAQSLKKTSEVVSMLQRVGAYADVEKVMESKAARAGKGKMRGRKTTQRRGPLVIYDVDEGIVNGCRNLPGVETCQVERLNLLQLAPGSHVGRFIVWTAGAFAKLDSIYGTYREGSSKKSGYMLPRSILSNPNISRIINSDEIQSSLRARKIATPVASVKKNALKNLGVRIKLNPAAKNNVRRELVKQRKLGVKKTIDKAKAKTERKTRRANSKAFGKKML